MTTKQCSYCRRCLPTACFSARSAAKDGLQSRCKECVAVSVSEYRTKYPDKAKAAVDNWRQANPTAYRQTVLQSRERAKNPKAKAAAAVRCRQRRDRLAAEPHTEAAERYKESQRRATSNYRKRHPEYALDQCQKRRARKKKAFVETVKRRTVYDRDGGRCYICCSAVAYEDMHLDHVVPLAKGGDHSYANCRTACSGCNLRKGAKLVSR